MAGSWVFATNDGSNSFFDFSIAAINRALKVNGCTPDGVSYASATYDNFPIGSPTPQMACKRATGCPARYPVVVCPVAILSHDAHGSIVDPGFPTFVKLFSAAPLLTP